MKKPITAIVCRYETYDRSEYEWDVAVYWSFDHDENPHDHDLLMSPSEWRKFSKCRSPKPNEAMKVQIRIEIVE